MKSLLIIATIYYTSIKPIFSADNCGTDTDRRLGLRVTNVQGAPVGIDGKVLYISSCKEYYS